MIENDLFNNFLRIISSKLSSMQYSIWFQNATFINCNDNNFKFKVKNNYIKSYIMNQYTSLVEDTLEELNLYNYNFTIYTEEDNIETTPIIKEKPKIEVVENREVIQQTIEIPHEEVHIEEDNTPFVSNLKSNLTFDNFERGISNNFAWTVAQEVADDPGNQNLNPFYLYGKSGTGKTHLIHAIGNKIVKEKGLKVLYVTSDTFENDYRNAVMSDNNVKYLNIFNKKYRSIDVLIIDDIQLLETKEKTQESLFNIFNELQLSNKQIIITSDRSVNDFKKFMQRLKTRFVDGMVATIEPTDKDLKIRILKSRLLGNEVASIINDDVLDYIADNTENNVRSLNGAINRLLAYISFMKPEVIDYNFAREALEDTISKGSVTNSMAKIIKAVAEYYDVTIDSLKSKKRKQPFAYARQVAMYMCKMNTDETMERIGLEFNKDHSTVIYACNTIEKECKKNPELRKTINEIKDKIVS